MPHLAELQIQVRDALVAGDTKSLLPLLIGGRDPYKRFAVHQRHYQASLVAALQSKFSGTAWLVGSYFFVEAARAFVRLHPPAAPCIAEFGERFPAFIANVEGAGHLPYLHDFATLEWHLGHAAVSVDERALPLQDLAGYSQDALPDLKLQLQSGVHYLRLGWPADDLIRLYLDHRAPDQYSIEAVNIWLEVRGARGAFQMIRLDAASWLFRRTLHQRQTIGEAAEMALDTDPEFDPGRALSALMGEGLVTAVTISQAGVDP